MDARILDQFKENVQPLPNGRLALKLGLALKEAPNKATLKRKREDLEAKIAADDSDDPLQDYVDYISWIQTNYPQGNNADSGLLNVLERCTLFFRDTPYYKNDARYLKVWLSYAGFSDLPRDIFVYLAKKGIGLELALYYEEFAKFLELNKQYADAKEVYEVGVERSARPLPRLLRSFQHFKDRTGTIPPTETSNIRLQVLRQGASASSVAAPNATKKPKISVHTDDRPMGFKEIVFQNNSSPDLAMIVDKTRENSVPVTSWDGATIQQKTPVESSRPARFEVFRDLDAPKPESTNTYEIAKENNVYYTIAKQTGKPNERLCLNLGLFYPGGGEEVCLGELLAQSAASMSIAVKQPQGFGQKQKALTASEPYFEHNHTFTIPLRDEDTPRRPKSPTITMMSRMTTNEVLKMFNDAAQNVHLEDELFKTFEESTNYDGFVTETMDSSRAQVQVRPENALYKGEAPSSPFLERPES